MKCRLKQYFLFFLGLLLFSCSRTEISLEEDYVKWIDKHLTKSKIVSGIELHLKFIPPEFLAYRELKGTNPSQSTIDSLVAYYSKSITLHLMFEPLPNSEGGSSDILYHGIESKEEYEYRLRELSFNFQEYIYLKTNLHDYPPVLFSFENTFGLTSGRLVYLVFNPEEKHLDLMKNGLTIVLNDLLFVTGTTYFSFSESELKKIPKIGFWN
jgi:hypothetical protein